MTDDVNIADALPARADADPDRTAIVCRRRGRVRTLTYAALATRSDALARGLARAGVTRGERALVATSPGPDLAALVFALLRVGAVPVLLDPGLGRTDLLACVRDCAPTVLVGGPRALLARLAFPGAFHSVRRVLAFGAPFPFADARLERLASVGAAPAPDVAVGPEDEAAIAFTSGSTGVPKGVIYRHGTFRAQVDAMRDVMGIVPGDVHLACVPIFALFDPALGCTTVVPDMDPRHPAAVDPAELARALREHAVTFGLGSPTIWRRLATHAEAGGETFPRLRRAFMFGAESPPELVARVRALLPNGEVITPYGATEGLPLTRIDGAEILRLAEDGDAPARGVCVGRPAGDTRVAIVAVTDAPIPHWDPSSVVPDGHVGEIVVAGPVVTDAYLNRPDLTAAAKIRDGERLWHRTGDLGWRDEAGRLWFCGRKSQRVETAGGCLLPVPCEAIYNAHAEVARTALVGVGAPGAQTPVLIAEARARRPADRARIANELRALGTCHPHTRGVETVLFRDAFPVDVRHNAKIRREELAAWAAHALRGGGR